MRKIIVALLASLLLVLALAAPAFADNLGPCNDSGGPGNSDYALGITSSHWPPVEIWATGATSPATTTASRIASECTD